ncbi:hypothetical protein CFC21_083497 [Triticum aestivum]|uniref:Uncharacterized protein n=3 Tax=Triticum TaxID=4564 RepID=A0A9R0Y1P8_TRITD|nr:hypothetical protein CFC21_083497 [Triticum aestivum]VAI46461.1 unnamed protein product [Triticum turgidum subsp. durum]
MDFSTATSTASSSIPPLPLSLQSTTVPHQIMRLADERTPASKSMVDPQQAEQRQNGEQVGGQYVKRWRPPPPRWMASAGFGHHGNIILFYECLMGMFASNEQRTAMR